MSEAKKDLSGFDVEVMTYPKTVQESQRQVAHLMPQPEFQSTTYNMSDISIRWGCTTNRVKKEISLGFLMKKLPNGRYSVSEANLIAWEQFMAEREERERRTKKRYTIILCAIFTVLLLGSFSFFLWLFYR